MLGFIGKFPLLGFLTTHSHRTDEDDWVVRNPRSRNIKENNRQKKMKWWIDELKEKRERAKKSRRKYAVNKT
jgi:hypothetical protein